MNHDPLCWTHIKGLPDVSVPCHTCEGIARVRADEQRRVIDRLEKAVQNLHGSNCITWAYIDSECNCYLIDAIKGDSE